MTEEKKCEAPKIEKECFSWKKLINGFNILNPILWSKTLTEVFRVVLVSGLVFGAVWGWGYLNGLKNRPINTDKDFSIAVTDKEAFTAMHVYAETEGYSVELATSVAFAGLDKLVQQRIIKSDEIVVLSCSGHTFPVDEHIVDEEGALDVRLERSD